MDAELEDEDAIELNPAKDDTSASSMQVVGGAKGSVKLDHVVLGEEGHQLLHDAVFYVQVAVAAVVLHLRRHVHEFSDRTSWIAFSYRC